MKSIKILPLNLFIAISLLTGGLCHRAVAQSKIWATAYYAGWAQGYSNNGNLPAQKIDFTAITQINHFALVPNANGTLDDASNSVSASNAAALIPLAHAAGTKVLITVGGWGTDVNFRAATAPGVLPTFVANLVSLMKTRGYDGIDVDWETLVSSDASQFTAFITSLRSALDAVSPRPMLTAATAWQPGIFASVASKFDQINLMTYDMAGAWPGWVTWHNAPLYDGGFKFPSTGGAVPSIDGWVSTFASSGVPLQKLGIGIDFYGYVWSGGDGTANGGATDPRQNWTSYPSVQGNVPYSTIMQNYYQSQYYRFDSSAQVSYLKIDNAGSANDKFISYDDDVTCKKKVQYARTRGIGGVIIWELGGGYRSSMPAGQQDVLLQSVKSALGVVATVLDVTPPSVSFTSPANGSTVANTVNLTATASDNIAVTGVQYQINGANLGAKILLAPYTYSWNTGSVANGSYTVTAIASDAAGNTSSASRSITVANAVVVPTRDSIPPVVGITSPAAGSTLSAVVNILATATDNVKMGRVQFTLDGANLGSAITAAPYNYSWNTASVSNGTHTIAATATDSAGNQKAVSIVVTVSNTAASTNDLWIYQEGLSSPWINTSWNASTVFNSTEYKYAGAYSMKITQGAWGGLSLHDGSWSSSVSINPASYQSLQFAVFGGASGINISVLCENDRGNSFPTVSGGTVPANTWKVITIPVTSLDPNRYLINRIDILETSGSSRTFYVDNFRFVGTVPAIAKAKNDAMTMQSVPAAYRLEQNFPNPFNPTTVIQYSLSNDATVSLEVYNTLGQLARSLVSEQQSAGEHSVTFDASTLASGAYMYRLTARDASNGVIFSEMKRMILIK